MKFHHLWYLLIVACKGYMVRVSPLVNPNMKFCINCAEFFTDKNEYKCRLFYNLDIITGRKTFYSCNTARQNSSLCGEDARFFFPNSSFGVLTNADDSDDCDT